MPTYQYACTECGHAFDQVQAFTDDALTTCPECSGRLRKVFNAVGVVFKGSGFYRNDSRAKESSSDSPSSSSTKTETASDAKAETKSESASKSASKSETKSSGDSSSKTPATSTSSASG